MTLHIRPLTEKDIPTFLDLVQGLADYESLPGPDEEARARMAQDALADPPVFHVLLAEQDGRLVGYSLFFFTYSTFLARPTLWVEDIFVLPSERGNGTGRMLMRELAREAVRRGCGRMEWSALDWNKTAIAFYEGLGAKQMSEWRLFRLTATELAIAAEG
ncbi:MAG TPA: GNAT family N-acetyltransferase [Chloroflexota bacterium]|nr:GNAT family N-acetyltransferase [Chloroflexota bacterium]